ncbi:MAG: Ig-like domain-containing protein [Bacteroidales bacterium]|nr:Ig-like domain-containing protein [Bacteroidales bacterium]
MNKKTILFSFFIAFAVLALTVSSCKKDESPSPLKLVSLMAGDIDLNGAVAPSNVPISPTIVATFNTDVDPATATASSIILKQDYDATNVTIDIFVSGKTITIMPTEPLGNGTLFELTFGSELASTASLPNTEFSRSFTTLGTFVPAGQIAYWNFEDNANDQVGGFNPDGSGVVDITYTASRNAAAGKAATFNGSTSIIEIPNGDQIMNTADFTVAFWVKTNSADKTSGNFVMGLAGWNGFQYEMFGDYTGSKFAIQYDLGNDKTGAEDMWFPANADLGWQGWTYAKALTPEEMMATIKDKWLQVIYTFNATTKVGTLYFNGEIMKSFDFNLWPDGDAKRGVVGLKYNGNALGNQLAFGFIQGRTNRTISDTWADYSSVDATNHFKGQLDDIRFFHKALSATEIGLMYDSEKP